MFEIRGGDDRTRSYCCREIEVWNKIKINLLILISIESTEINNETFVINKKFLCDFVVFSVMCGGKIFAAN